MKILFSGGKMRPTAIVLLTALMVSSFVLISACVEESECISPSGTLPRCKNMLGVSDITSVLGGGWGEIGVVEQATQCYGSFNEPSSGRQVTFLITNENSACEYSKALRRQGGTASETNETGDMSFEYDTGSTFIGGEKVIYFLKSNLLVKITCGNPCEKNQIMQLARLVEGRI